MDEKRLQAYLNLIQSLLSFPVEKEQEILIGNINLIDSGLLHIIEQVSAMLASQGNQNAVNRLRELADKLTIALNRPLVANPEAYRHFVLELLNTMRQSEGDPQVMYPLLQANLDKLNDSFAQVLHILGSESFHKVTPENAQSVAATIHDFGNLIQQFPLGNRANNIEIAIACYEVAATVYTREAFPEHWGLIQSSLGTAYLDRIKENKAENIEQAIRYYEAALEVRNCKESPTQWATTQVNLGGAYLDRIKGDRADNLEMAIQCHQAALQVYDREKFPKKWATIQNNLGGVYLRRIRGNRSDNIETAIACFDTALQIRTYEANPQEWAMTQQNLGVAYLEYLKGDSRSEFRAVDSLLKSSFASLQT
jgi:tetratricopeptide (TPR) repeat protein